jgi:cysteine synthase A
VATDGAEMYASELQPLIDRDHGGDFDEAAAAAVHARFLAGVDTDQLWELGEVGRRRIFNLGYYTWVEQQGIPFDTFEARRHQTWWDDLRPYCDHWDEMISEFNQRTGVEL